MTFDPEASTTIELTRAVALVLFEWLHSNEDAGTTPGDTAERVALWNLSGALERVLVEPFNDDYDNLLKAAKTRLTPDQDLP
ncbi:MAG: hypothetical protein QNJ75_05125 [Acidimicrobiia bacterium]|nr:hypothetical protein [Acidimicrobiia bacterium]